MTRDAMEKLFSRVNWKARLNLRRLRGEYIPHIPKEVDITKLIRDISNALSLNVDEVKTKFQEYRNYSVSRKYQEWLGEYKTLSFEEAFVVYVMLDLFRPPTIIEIGTQYGKSSRKILDMNNQLGIDTALICFDIEDQVRYFAPCEAELVLKDITNTFQQEVLETYDTGFIFLDAHPYTLLKNVAAAVLSTKKWVMAIHDCSPYLCNPKMSLDVKDPNVTSLTGVWERHVLAELFGISDPLSPALDHAETGTHSLTIFSTQHGVATITPKAI